MLNVIVLAAGDASRFVGYTVPKQFLKFNLPQHQPRQMWRNVVASITKFHRTFLVARHDHRLHVEYGRETVIWTDRTRGQAHTLLNAIHWFVDHGRAPGEYLVVNCDAGFAPGVLDNLIEHGYERWGVAALTFVPPPETAGRWSYVDQFGDYFHSAIEKRALSNQALAGAYFFDSIVELYEVLKSVVSNNQEPYISEVFGEMYGWKRAVKMRYEDFYDWGTPEALNKFMGYVK